jgi:hypothetical protein
LLEVPLENYTDYIDRVDEGSPPFEALVVCFPEAFSELSHDQRRFLRSHPDILFYANYDTVFFNEVEFEYESGDEYEGDSGDGGDGVENEAGTASKTKMKRPTFSAWDAVNNFDFLRGSDSQLMWQSWFRALGFSGGFDAVFWLGPKNVITGLHQEWEALNFLHQLVGAKEVWLYSPDQTHLLYPSSKYAMGASNSEVRPFDPWPPRHAQGRQEQPGEHHEGGLTEPLDLFPLFRQAVPLKLLLRPGDVLWIPSGWWHTVRSLGTTVSVSGRVVTPCQSFTYLPSKLLQKLHEWGLYKKGNCICHRS